MLSTARSKVLEKAIAPSASIPSFLLPAFGSTLSSNAANSSLSVKGCFASRRQFSASAPQQSQIGKAPLSIPPGVKFEVLPPVGKKRPDGWGEEGRRSVVVEGPLGMFFFLVFWYLYLRGTLSVDGG